MAQQFYRPQRGSQRRDNGDDDEIVSPVVPHRAADVSNGAQQTLNNIDDVLNEHEQDRSMYNPVDHGGSAPLTSQQLKDRENAGKKAPEQEEEKKEDSAEKEQPSKKRGWKGLSRRAKAGVGGGIIGIGLGFGSIGGLTLISGPLQFVHFAQQLHDTHIAQNENTTNMRLGKLFRYWKTGSIGRTRLGIIGNHYYDKAMAQLKEAGIKPEYTGGDLQDGFSLDRTTDGSPFKDMSPEEALAKYQELYGSKANPRITNGEVKLGSDGFFGDRSTVRTLLRATGSSAVDLAVESRAFSKFGLIPGWHNLGIDRLKANTTAAIEEYFKEKWTKIFEGDGAPPATIDTSNAKDQTGTDQNGNPQTTAASGDTGTVSSTKMADTLKAFASSKVGISVNALATVTGILCILKTINDNVALIRYVQIIKPLVNIGMAMVSVGDQVKSQQDVSLDELSYLSQYFYDSGKDSSGTQVRPASSWTDSLPMRQNFGESGGIDMDQGTKDALGHPGISWLSWTDSGPMKVLCSTGGQIVAGVAGFVLGIFSGSIVSTLVGTVVSFIAIPKIVSFVTHLAAGKAIDIATAYGSTFGNYADYGTALGANAQALKLGGTQLSQAQQTALLQDNMDIVNQDRSHETFFARAFDPTDPQSITGNLIDQSRGSLSANFAALTTGFMHMGSAILKMPIMLFNAKVHAAPQAYQYPFAIYGFSMQDQTNPAVENPFQNAEDAATILSGPNGQDYITKAKNCFGVTISQAPGDNGQLVWDAVGTDNITATAYNGDYDNSGCTDSSDPNWLKIRFFILDTSVMEGYACGEFADQQSCDNSTGGGSSGTSTTASATSAPAAPTTTGGIPTGDTITLAKQISTNVNITFQTKQDSDYFGEVVATGKQAACGGPAISPTLLGVILKLSESYKIVLGSFDDGHTCDSSFHPKGAAVDVMGVNALDGSSGTGSTMDYSAPQLPILKQFYQSAGEVLASAGGGGLGEQQCFGGPAPTVSAPPNVYFNDTCDHLQLDTRGR